VTITGRAYLDIWSDRHCPSIGADNKYSDPQAKAIDACNHYLSNVVVGGMTAMGDDARMEVLTGQKGVKMFDRENGARFMTSIVAEVATKQQWSLWFMLEGAPFQKERALFTDLFNQPMFASDFRTYARAGVTYKF
jgi:hypothetical protein